MAALADVVAVRGALPSLASTATYPDIDAAPNEPGVISDALDNWAARIVGSVYYGASYTTALRLAARCLLAELAGVTATNPGGAAGPVTSATAGPQTITLADLGPVAMSNVDAFLKRNVHGQALLAIRASRRAGMPTWF